MYQEIIMGGIGGQGIMVIGNLLAQAAFMEDLNVTYIPIYGVEKRGGQADCTVVISNEEIGSPIVGYPQSCVIMSKPSLLKYAPKNQAPRSSSFEQLHGGPKRSAEERLRPSSHPG